MGLFSKIGGWINSMFTNRDVEEAIGVSVVTSDEMVDNQELWRQVFSGNAPWNSDKVPSLMLGSSICTEVARAVTIESESEVTGSTKAEWLNEQYRRFFKEIRNIAEKLCANGTILLEPSINDDIILVEAFENNMYYPIRYDKQGNLIEVVFQYSIIKGDDYYTLLKHCVFEDNNFTKYFYVFKSKNPDRLGREIALSEVPEWSYLEDANGLTFTDVERPWYVVLDMPSLNNIEQEANQGMAIFANAIEDIRKADELEELTEHEFKAGRLKQNVTSDMLNKNSVGDWDIDKDVFNVFEGNGGDNPNKQYINTYNPTPRQSDYNARSNDIKRNIEFKCQISFGIISDPQSQDKTATEVEAGKQRFYTTVKDIQKVLEQGCRELVEIMDDMATRYYLPTGQGEYDMSFWWDDSILVNAEEKQALIEKEFRNLLTLFQQGLIDGAVVLAFYKENSDFLSKISPEAIEEARLELPSAFEEGE